MHQPQYKLYRRAHNHYARISSSDPKDNSKLTGVQGNRLMGSRGSMGEMEPPEER